MGSARPGSKLGSFMIISPIGAGGMGEVYRAHDARLQRDVALKLLPSARIADEGARGRLLREARAAASLNHPHICTVFEVGEADGQAYIAMELVEGETLDRKIPPGGLPPDEAVDYGRQIAEGVAHAHGKGVLHRDLKTSNLMLTPGGHVKVLDFGLAKRMTAGDGSRPTEAVTVVTEPGRVAGTLVYMAPEQLRGEAATAASDVWSLGVVLHELAAGERPFDGKTSFEAASAILEQPPRALPPRVPEALRAIVARCLAKEPARRYQNAGELRAAMNALPQTSARRPSPLLASGAALVTRRSLTIAGVAAAAVAAIVLSAPRALLDRFIGAGEPRIASIAVLPLENISGNRDEEHLASGMQAGLISELARLRSLDRVIDRGSTRRFADSARPITEIAAVLGVDAVVTGSVMRAGDRVQVTAQLIDASTARHLWSARFERDLRDVLSVQNDVVSAVATAIDADVSTETRQRWRMARPVDPATYEAYLRGMHLVSRGGSRDDRLKGLAILQEAVDRDPGNAHAYAGLAAGYVTLGHGPGADADAWPKARAAALRAVTLDPTLAEAHSALAEVRAYYERDWRGAEESFRRANQLNPNIAFNHYHYAWYLALFSRWDEANAAHQRAQELDPLTPVHTAYFGALYLYQDRYDEALAEAQRATDFAPNAPAPWLVLGQSLFHKGRLTEAEAAFRKGASIAPALGEFELGMFLAESGRQREARAILDKLEAQPPVPFNVWSLSQLNIALGDVDRAFHWLHYRPAHAFLPWIRVHPPYRAIRKDPRFGALLAELKLPMP